MKLLIVRDYLQHCRVLLLSHLCSFYYYFEAYRCSILFDKAEKLTKCANSTTFYTYLDKNHMHLSPFVSLHILYV